MNSVICFTIDPDTAKDFDDALTLSKDKKGHYHLGRPELLQKRGAIVAHRLDFNVYPLAAGAYGGTQQSRLLLHRAGKETAFGDVIDRLTARPEETEFERGTRRFGMLILETVVGLGYRFID